MNNLTATPSKWTVEIMTNDLNYLISIFDRDKAV